MKNPEQSTAHAQRVQALIREKQHVPTPPPPLPLGHPLATGPKNATAVRGLEASPTWKALGLTDEDGHTVEK